MDYLKIYGYTGKAAKTLKIRPALASRRLALRATQDSLMALHDTISQAGYTSAPSSLSSSPSASSAGGSMLVARVGLPMTVAITSSKAFFRA